MNIEDSHLGYVVYAAKTITYDGSIPDTTDGEILAKTGVRGVIALIGHVEVESVRSVFLVCLEGKT